MPAPASNEQCWSGLVETTDRDSVVCRMHAVAFSAEGAGTLHIDRQLSSGLIQAPGGCRLAGVTYLFDLASIAKLTISISQEAPRQGAAGG